MERRTQQLEQEQAYKHETNGDCVVAGVDVADGLSRLPDRLWGHKRVAVEDAGNYISFYGAEG